MKGSLYTFRGMHTGRKVEFPEMQLQGNLTGNLAFQVQGSIIHGMMWVIASHDHRISDGAWITGHPCMDVVVVSLCTSMQCTYNYAALHSLSHIGPHMGSIG